MTPLQIVALVAGGVLVGAAAFFLLGWYNTEKRTAKFDALGTVVGWQNVKLPFLGRAIVQCSKKGRPIQVQSGLTLRSKKPKIGLKRMWTVSVYHAKDNSPVYVARKKKAA